MTILIQSAVIVVAILVVLVALGQRSTHGGRAWQKVGLIVLAAMMIIAVLFPDITNKLAHIMGVGRGADLLLYVTVVAFIFYAVNGYLHRQDQRYELHCLARKVALLEARAKYSNRLK